MLAHQALVRGDIDLYPEYTGTALTTILNYRPFSDPAAAIALVRARVSGAIWSGMDGSVGLQ